MYTSEYYNKYTYDSSLNMFIFYESDGKESYDNHD